MMKNRRERIKGLVMLRVFIRKLRRALTLSASRGLNLNAVGWFDEERRAITYKDTIPEDVKEGQFAVTAVKGGEPKRFVVGLSNLANPAFLRLLEQAEEEYGYEQDGILAVPCQPEELQKILEDSRKKIKSKWLMTGCCFSRRANMFLPS